jgi:hypothetical protein
VRFLPDGNFRSVVVISVCIIFIGLFLSLILKELKLLLFHGKIKRKAVLLIIINFILMINSFAFVYSSLGIINNAVEGTPVVYSYDLCLYYSIVTFTTLGYGDFYPTGIGRAVAAIEALTGFVVLGIFASTAITILKPDKKEKD